MNPWRHVGWCWRYPIVASFVSRFRASLELEASKERRLCDGEVSGNADAVVGWVEVLTATINSQGCITRRWWVDTHASSTEILSLLVYERPIKRSPFRCQNRMLLETPSAIA